MEAHTDIYLFVHFSYLRQNLELMFKPLLVPTQWRFAF